jgi:hypothetical protein
MAKKMPLDANQCPQLLRGNEIALGRVTQAQHTQHPVIVITTSVRVHKIVVNNL